MTKLTSKSSAIIAVFMLLSTTIFSQKPINVTYERDRDGKGYIFECQNNSFISYTVTVTFSNLSNLSADVTLPYQVTVSPGKTRLFQLKQTSESMGTPNFNYSTSYRKGCEKTKTDTLFAYLLPISPNKTTKVTELYNIGQKFGNTSAPKDWYALAFNVSEGDTIFAARKGIVGAIASNREPLGESLAYNSEVNFVEIQHEDCTFAKYELFKKGGIFVQEGDIVQAGQPLGIISSNNYVGGSQARFSVSYSFVEPVVKGGKKTDEKHYYAYVPVRFWVNNAVEKLVTNTKYTSEHPEVLIVKEMTKKEKKRRLENVKK
jgi:Peptidase family M23